MVSSFMVKTDIRVPIQKNKQKKKCFKAFTDETKTGKLKSPSADMGKLIFFTEKDDLKLLLISRMKNIRVFFQQKSFFN